MYAGPFRVFKKLSSVDTGGDAGMYHVNLQPFHSWDTAMPTASSYGEVEMSLPLDVDFDSQTDREESANAEGVDTDYSNEPLNRHLDESSPEHCTEQSLDIVPDSIDIEAVSGSHDLTPYAVTDEPTNQGHYGLRQREVPRFTSDWTVNK